MAQKKKVRKPAKRRKRPSKKLPEDSPIKGIPPAKEDPLPAVEEAPAVGPVVEETPVVLSSVVAPEINDALIPAEEAPPVEETPTPVVNEQAEWEKEAVAKCAAGIPEPLQGIELHGRYLERSAVNFRATGVVMYVTTLDKKGGTPIGPTIPCFIPNVKPSMEGKLRRSIKS